MKPLDNCFRVARTEYQVVPAMFENSQRSISNESFAPAFFSAGFSVFAFLLRIILSSICVCIIRKFLTFG